MKYYVKYGAEIIKFVDGVPYVFEDGKWAYKPQMAKIIYDVSYDYEEISEEEAQGLLR